MNKLKTNTSLSLFLVSKERSILLLITFNVLVELFILKSPVIVFKIKPLKMIIPINMEFCKVWANNPLYKVIVLLKSKVIVSKYNKEIITKDITEILFQKTPLLILLKEKYGSDIAMIKNNKKISNIVFIKHLSISGKICIYFCLS